MFIVETEDIDIIENIHKKIYLEKFPIDSMMSKEKRGYKLLKYIIEDQNKLVGYCIVINKKEEKNLHAWVGGVLPQYQGKGYFSEFYDWLIKKGENLEYLTITGNTDNFKHNMIRMMIKKGFYIVAVSETNYGDGIKINMKYEIHEGRTLRIILTTKCNYNCFFCHHEGIAEQSTEDLSIPSLERILVQARRMCVKEITLTGGEPTMLFDRIQYTLKYCNSWDNKPHIKIVTNGSLLTTKMIGKLNYKGKLTINLSVHAIGDRTRCLISKNNSSNVSLKKLIKGLRDKGINVRFNSIILNQINNQDEMENIIRFAIENNVYKINFMELLVTKSQEQLHKFYISVDEIEKKLRSVVLKFGEICATDLNEKKRVYKIRNGNKVYEISVYRLSCRCGCKDCKKNNDITIDPKGYGHPCYLEPNVIAGNAVESLEDLIKYCDDFVLQRHNDYSENKLYWGEVN